MRAPVRYRATTAVLALVLLVTGVRAQADDGPGPVTEIKQGAVSAAHAVKEVAVKVGHGVKEGAVAVGHKAGEAGRDIGHGAKRSAKAVGQGTRKAAQDVGKAIDTTVDHDHDK